MANIEFIITAFGERYLSQLPPLVYSISLSHPNSKIHLLWGDLSQRFINILLKSFPKLSAENTIYNNSSELAKRISGKTQAWNYAVGNSTASHLILLDTDTLVLKDVNWLCDYDTDIIITSTGSFYPINSGVIYCRNSPNVQKFFRLWYDKTNEILNSPVLFARVNDKKQPFGGADQMALMEIIHFRQNKTNYTCSISDKLIKIKILSCSLINEIRSVAITDKTHIIHYKGGWRPILFYGEDFTRNRPKKASWDMYILYLKTYYEAIDRINSKTRMHFTPKYFGLYTPLYLNTRNWQEYNSLYPLFQIIAGFSHYKRILFNLIMRRDLNN